MPRVFPVTERFHVVRSLMGSKHRTVNAENAGSSPVGPPRSILDFRFWILDWKQVSRNIDSSSSSNPKSKIQNAHGAVAERRMHFAVDEDDDGSSPFGPANTYFGF